MMFLIIKYNQQLESSLWMVNDDYLSIIFEVCIHIDCECMFLTFNYEEWISFTFNPLFHWCLTHSKQTLHNTSHHSDVSFLKDRKILALWRIRTRTLTSAMLHHNISNSLVIWLMNSCIFCIHVFIIAVKIFIENMAYQLELFKCSF